MWVEMKESANAQKMEQQLKEWRESRGRKTGQSLRRDRRLLRVNGQEVVVVKKPREKPRPSETGAVPLMEPSRSPDIVGPPDKNQ